MQNFLWRSSTLIFVSVVACACGAAKKETVSVPAESTLESSFGVDPTKALRADISRIFGDSPVAGQVPQSITWSPSGAAVVFTRRDTQSTELWIHEVVGHRERPVSAHPGHSAGSPMFCGEDALIYQMDGELYLFDWKLSRTEQLTDTGGAVAAAACSPDGGAVAFSKENDLWVLRFSDRASWAVTRDGRADVSHGTVTWLYREEFGTQKGFGWSPDGARLWFFTNDVCDVQKKLVLEPDVTKARNQPYPNAGTANPRVRISVANAFPEGTGSGVNYIAVEGSPESYVPSVAWHPDGERLYVVYLDRLQTVLQLKSCPTDGKKCRTLVEERDPRWVEYYGAPYINPDTKEIFMLSGRSGRVQIHRFGPDGLSKGQVTNGDFDVKSIDYVDPEQGTIVFTGNVESPRSWGLYEVGFGGGKLLALSQQGGTHAAVFSPDGKLLTDTYSDIKTPPRCDILTRSGMLEAPLSPRDRRAYSPTGITTDFVTIETPEGRRFDTMLTRPEALETSRKYPVVIYVYGGPHAQVVKDAFHSTMTPWRDLLARHGFLVFSLDGRGAFGYGRDFVTPIHLKLGKAAVEDQLVGVRYLKTLPFVDRTRIGIFGWSFGGTVTLWSMLRTDAFRAGAAVAPVTDWRDYDTAYTERYMQRPEDNPDGYADTSLIPYAKKLKGALFLAHGLSDNNVHLENTVKMMDALMKAKQPFEAMLYPGQSHGISASYARVDLFTRLTRFFEEHLQSHTDIQGSRP